MVEKITITEKVLVITDVVAQFCRQYELPYGKGLNICYTTNEPDDILVNVEVIEWPRPNYFQFRMERISENHWRVSMNYVEINFSKNLYSSSLRHEFKSQKTCFSVKHSGTNGEYKFTRI